MSVTESAGNAATPATAAALVQCPYCAEDIQARAIVCRHCGRDLFFFTPIMQRLAALEAAVQVGDATLASGLSERLDRIEQAVTLLAAHELTDTTPSPLPPSMPVAAPWWHSIGVFAGCALLLVGAFAMLSLVFDVHEVYLRAAAILIPIPFGFMHAARRPYSVVREVLLGVLIAGAFVTIMTGILAHLQDLPWAPQDMREWREVITFGSSVLFAYVTGGMLAKILAERTGTRSTGALALEAARLVASFSSRAGARGEQVRSLASSMQTFTSNLVVVSTSAAALWTGIGKLFF